MNHAFGRRKGTALVVVLVGIMVVALLAAALAQTVVARQRQLRIDQQQAQAEWLAESAAERAAAALRKDANYKGEIWKVSSVELTGERPGMAGIVVAPVEGTPRRRAIKIEAHYPDDPVRRVAVTKQLFIDLPSTGDAP